MRWANFETLNRVYISTTDLVRDYTCLNNILVCCFLGLNINVMFMSPLKPFFNLNKKSLLIIYIIIVNVVNAAKKRS